MKFQALRDIVKKDIPLHYRNEYSATAVFVEPGPREIQTPVEFVIERSATGKKDIRVHFPTHPNYPLIPVLKALKEAIAHLDGQGQLL